VASIRTGKTTKSVVGPTAKKYRGVVKAAVAVPASGGSPAASVVSASPDEVVILLFVNQVTESTQVSGSRVGPEPGADDDDAHGRRLEGERGGRALTSAAHLHLLAT
jgi:hypothetical protein